MWQFPDVWYFSLTAGLCNVTAPDFNNVNWDRESLSVAAPRVCSHDPCVQTRLRQILAPFLLRRSALFFHSDCTVDDTLSVPGNGATYATAKADLPFWVRAPFVVIPVAASCLAETVRLHARVSCGRRLCLPLKLLMACMFHPLLTATQPIKTDRPNAICGCSNVDIPKRVWLRLQITT